MSDFHYTGIVAKIIHDNYNIAICIENLKKIIIMLPECREMKRVSVECLQKEQLHLRDDEKAIS